VQGRRPAKLERRGSIAVLAAFFAVVMAIFIALAVDIGYIAVARTELQRSADSAALAAAAELLQCSSAEQWSDKQEHQVRRMARQFVQSNSVANATPTIDLNFSQSPDGDLLLGEVADWGAGERTFRVSRPGEYNAVQVRVARNQRINGEVRLFFANVMGIRSKEIEARATAAFMSSFRGFRAPRDKENVPILPFALEEESYNAMLRGEGADQFSRDPSTGDVASNSDGRPEMDLYPLDTGSGGNCGTVDIGSNNTKTPTLRRQIRDGITPQELDFHGGELALDNRGELQLSADPGLKAGPIERELTGIIGEPRIVPIFRSVEGNGQKASYTIVGFAGVCVVSAKLRGQDKHVRIQACPIVVRGGIPSAPGEETSRYIYSPIAIVN
jgi:Flp pilus assembly protein TadG